MESIKSIAEQLGATGFSVSEGFTQEEEAQAFDIITAKNEICGTRLTEEAKRSIRNLKLRKIAMPDGSMVRSIDCIKSDPDALIKFTVDFSKSQFDVCVDTMNSVKPGLNAKPEDLRVDTIVPAMSYYQAFAYIPRPASTNADPEYYGIMRCNVNLREVSKKEVLSQGVIAGMYAEWYSRSRAKSDNVFAAYIRMNKAYAFMSMMFSRVLRILRQKPGFDPSSLYTITDEMIDIAMAEYDLLEKEVVALIGGSFDVANIGNLTENQVSKCCCYINMLAACTYMDFLELMGMPRGTALSFAMRENPHSHPVAALSDFAVLASDAMKEAISCENETSYALIKPSVMYAVKVESVRRYGMTNTALSNGFTGIEQLTAFMAHNAETILAKYGLIPEAEVSDCPCPTCIKKRAKADAKPAENKNTAEFSKKEIKEAKKLLKKLGIAKNKD